MLHDREQRPGYPGNMRCEKEVPILVDAIVVSDIEAFLVELGRLSSHMELVVDRLVDVILAGGSPGGNDLAMRSYVIGLVAAEVARRRRQTRRHLGNGLPVTSSPLQGLERPGSVVPNLREVVTADLFARQAELEACLEPAIGNGVLTRRAAGLLIAMILPAASRARPDGRAPFSLDDIELTEKELFQLGEPLLGVTVDGRETIRLVYGATAASDEVAARSRVIYNLLELARVTSLSRNYGLVVVPHLDQLDELPKAA